MSLQPTKVVTKKLIYLASPYSHPDIDVREERFRDAARAAAVLMHAGLFVFSPIAHTHPIVVLSGDNPLPHGWDYWQEYDRLMLSQCYLMIVLMLAGWDKSKGIGGETEICRSLGIPFRYARPDDLRPLAIQLVTTKQSMSTTLLKKDWIGVWPGDRDKQQ